MSGIDIKRGNRPSILEVSIKDTSDPLGEITNLVKRFYENKLKIRNINFRESNSSDELWMTINNAVNKENYFGRIIIKNSIIFRNYKLEFDIMRKDLNKNYDSDKTAEQFLEYYRIYTKPN